MDLSTFDPKELEAAEKLLVRERALSDLYFFATFILGFKDFGEIHRELCFELEQRQSTDTIVWLLPRAHFKTSLINEAYNLWIQIQKPRRILIASATLDICIDMIRRTKMHIRSEKFMRYFPEMRIVSPERMDQIYLEGNKWGEANWEITSPDHNVVAKHYDKIVMDDVVNAENASTDSQQKKLLNWFQSLNGLKDRPGVPVDVIGTYWNDGDLYSHLIDELKIPCYVRGAYDPKDPENTVLFPERFTFQQLQEIRRTAGESVFACQFLNDPLAGEHAVFNAKNIRYIELTKEEIMRHYRVITIDPAISTKAESDHTAVVCASKDHRGDIYIHSVTYGHWKALEIIEMIYRMRDEFDPHRIGIEAEGFQKTLIHFMEEKARHEQRPVFVEPLKSGRSLDMKEMRIKGLAPWYESGRIWHLQDGKGIAAFEAELLRFPKGRRDDMIDAASYAFNLLCYGTPEQQIEKGSTVNSWLKSLDSARKEKGLMGREHLSIDDLFDYVPFEINVKS